MSWVPSHAIALTKADDGWYAEWLVHTDAVPPEPFTPVPDLTAWLSIARQTAAGRCPSAALFGYVEDELPLPWSLLVSDDPRAFFRRLYERDRDEAGPEAS